MAEPFIGEVRIWGLTFAPKDWTFCNGQLLPISQNQSLFALLGTTFGGNGTTSFGVPDLRGRVPMHPDASTPQGGMAGVETVTLTQDEMPSHTHTLQATSTPADSDEPASHAFAPGGTAALYRDATNLLPLGGNTIVDNGGGQSHTNMQPSLVLNFCMSLTGLFPSRN